MCRHIPACVPLVAAILILALSGQAALAETPREAVVAALIDKAAASPPLLRVMLREMPKGGDLHNHLGGTVYAEDFLGWAMAAGLCADAADQALVPPPCAAGRSIRELAQGQPAEYGRMVDALSTRGWQGGVGRNGISGHDQFFATFDKFSLAAQGHGAEALVAARRIGAGDRLSYLELQHNPDPISRYTFAAPDLPLDEAGLAARYAAEVAGVGPVVAKARAELDRDEAKANASMGCDGAKPEPACGVTVHYLAYALRALPPTQVFRSLILAFALAERDPRFVGVNIVQPEDWPVPLRDYDLHMAMFRFLEGKYPHVHRSLHAGELTLGLVAPADMRGHIAKASAAGAERIGHGTGIAYEDHARATMAQMARNGIVVEINLSSNAVILGVAGADHPLALYRGMGVPFVLSTDDQGVLRSDMTQEYVRAVREQGLRYPDLKTAARASLEYAFLPGASLWRSRQLGVAVAACTPDFGAAACRTLLAASEKARLEASLETQLDGFEQAQLAVADKPKA